MPPRNNPVTVMSNIDWLNYLASTRLYEYDEVIHLHNDHWIVEPRTFKQEHQDRLNVAYTMKKSLGIILLCDVSDEEYNRAISSMMTDVQLKIIGLKNISLDIMADVLNKLDFTKLRKIGVRNLSDDTLWLLYGKMIDLEVNNRQNITVFCGNGISDEWRNKFKALKIKSPNNSLFHDYIRYNRDLLAKLIKVSASVRELKIDLDNFKTKPDKTLVEKYEKAIAKIDKLRLKVAEQYNEFVEAERKVNKVTNDKFAVEREKQELKNKHDVLDASLKKEIEAKTSLKTENTSLKEQIKTTNNNSQSLRIMLGEALTSCRTQVTNNQTLTAENKSLASRLHRAEQDSIGLKNEMECAKMLAPEVPDDLRKELADAKEDNERMRVHLRDQHSEAQKNAAERVAHEKTISDLKSKLSALSADKNTLNNQVAKLSSAVSDLTTERDELKTSLTKTIEELETQKILLTNLEENVDALEVSNNDLRAQAETPITAYDVLCVRMKTLEEEKAQLIQDKQELRTENDELITENANVNQRKFKLKHDLEEAQARLNKYKINPKRPADQDSEPETEEHKHKRRKHKKYAELPPEVREQISELKVAKAQLLKYEEDKKQIDAIISVKDKNSLAVSREKADKERNLAQSESRLRRAENAKREISLKHAAAIKKIREEKETLEREKAALQQELAATKTKIKAEQDFDSIFKPNQSFYNQSEHSTSPLLFGRSVSTPPFMPSHENMTGMNEVNHQSLTELSLT